MVFHFDGMAPNPIILRYHFGNSVSIKGLNPVHTSKLSKTPNESRTILSTSRTLHQRCCSFNCRLRPQVGQIFVL